MSAFLSKLEQSRKELLDLTGRNRLTNYPNPTAKRGGISIIDELPEQIFQILVQSGKVMSFLATTENVTGQPTFLLPLLDSQSFGEIQQENIPERYTDTKLQTSLNLDDLDRHLRRMYGTARTFVEEQGINALYLAMGILEWYESDSSQEKRLAPLVLVPVEIYRDNVRTRYKLRYTGDEIGSNISLQEKLLREFSIRLPHVPDSDEFDIITYFDAVAESVVSRPRWKVDQTAIVIDFFHFNKFQMYKDLDITSWNNVTGAKEHPVLSTLLGSFTFLSETMNLTSVIPFSSSHQPPEMTMKNLVVDADSSQVKAIQAAMSGKNLVIQGPPGTGKSQTITNIVAEALGQGKTVLFVAEKMAALEVVKRRLDKLGLGDACLELHSHKANKKTFLSELERTLSLAEPMLQTQEHNMRVFQDERDHLDRYCAAVNDVIGETEITPYQAYGFYLQADKRLVDTAPPLLQLPNIEIWKETDFRYRLAIIERFQSLLTRIGQPNQHPFWGSRRRVYLPADQQILQNQTITAERSVGQLQLDADFAAETLGAPSAKKRSDAETLLHLLELAVLAPQMSGIILTAPEWKSQSGTIFAALNIASEYERLCKEFQKYLIPDAWKENLLPARRALALHGGRVSRFWSREYRNAQNLLKSICHRDLPTSFSDQVTLIDTVLEVQRLAPKYEANQPLLHKTFGQRFGGVDANWAELHEIAEWMKNVHTSGFDDSSVQLLFRYIQNDPPKDKTHKLRFDLERSLSTHINTVKAVAAFVELDEQSRFDRDQSLIDQTFFEQTQLLKDWVTRCDQLQEMVSYNDIVESLLAQQLASIVDVATGWRYASSRLVDLVKRTRYEQLINRAMKERSALATFNGSMHQHQINRFRELDSYLLSYNRSALMHQHWHRLPKYYASTVAILREQFNRKRGHKSIRALMNDAGAAVQAIKPIFMMSPFSVATFLPPGCVKFDLVIFDEASQVKPVDALGAILRGQQTIVVGDDKQLPPSNFFNSTIDGELEDDNIAADAESILGLFRAKSARTEMLQWHYRSRHESLIAVSNFEFYANRLIVFPSPDKEREQFGLVYHHLPQTTYSSRGDGISGGHNDGEAQSVANAVMNHARTSPKQTLLVATFNQHQREVIEDHLERLRKLDTSCEDFFNSNPDEPFVIKNLENVQGDERDVVFISVGFGRDKDNKISMNFGPLNKDGGERRLNVLITRARERCEVFTNLTKDDIDLARTQSKGVSALKRFLKYAETGILDIPESTAGGVESPFEQVVLNALQEAGYQVATQVGTGGYRIDMAIIDSIQPGRYLLGIECDGATYHSSQSARDRDRLRQEVLERMGWQIHRIWSTDWFRNPQRELQRVKESIEIAKAKKVVEVGSDMQPSPLDDNHQHNDTVQHIDLHPLTNIEFKKSDPQSLSLQVENNKATKSQYKNEMELSRRAKDGNGRSNRRTGEQLDWYSKSTPVVLRGLNLSGKINGYTITLVSDQLHWEMHLIAPSSVTEKSFVSTDLFWMQSTPSETLSAWYTSVSSGRASIYEFFDADQIYYGRTRAGALHSPIDLPSDLGLLYKAKLKELYFLMR